MASTQVYYALPDSTWVAKALPEEWRLDGENNVGFAQRCGHLFEFDKGWSVMKETPEIQADPVQVMPTLGRLQSQIAALSSQLATLVVAQPVTAAEVDSATASPVEE